MKKIKGVFFDLGGTLRICEEAPEHQKKARARMAELVGRTDVQDFQLPDGLDPVVRHHGGRLTLPVGGARVLEEDHAAVSGVCAGSVPENCAYVGDNPVRDVEGAVDAGYGSMVLFEDAGSCPRHSRVSRAALGATRSAG